MSETETKVMSNMQRNRVIVGVLSKANHPVTAEQKLREAFAGVREPYATVVEKELRILRSYELTINAAQKQCATVVERLEAISKKVTADAKSTS